MKDSYVYILASQRNGTMYVGSTSNLVQRIWEHKNKVWRDLSDNPRFSLI